MAKFNPPGHPYGRQRVADTYPDVVGELARAEKGLAAPTSKPRPGRFPLVGREEQKRAGDRAVARQKWKPPVDQPPRPALDRYPMVAVEGRFDDPKKPVKVPPVRNEDGSEWKPPVDDPRPRVPRSVYPQIVGMTRVGRVKKYHPPNPKSDWNYRASGQNPDDQFVANCVNLSGEGMRQYLDYDPVMGELTWRVGSGPKTGQNVPHNPNCVLWFKGVRRNVFAVIYLIVLDRLPRGWVQPANKLDQDWSWENIKPSEQNPC